MKVAVVTPIPTPYRDPFWNAVAERTDIELDVFYCRHGKQDRPWSVDWSRQFRSEVLFGWNLLRHRGDDASCYYNPGLAKRLRRGDHDAIVVAGYNHPSMWVAMSFARRRGVPFYLMNESHLLTQRSTWKRQLKQWPVQWVMKHASGGFPTGTLATRYMVHFGARPESLASIPNAPDVVHLKHRTAELRRRRPALRRSLGLSDLPTVLFVGRLIAKKRAGLLIDAFAKACPAETAQLVIVGDGVERATLERRVSELGRERSIRFAGFAQPDQMPRWYAAADVFALPSSETWGVAVLEALASGLPVITTDEVGCHPDVLTTSQLGVVVAARNEDALVEALRSQLAADVDPQCVHREWREVLESLRYENIAARFANHLHGTPTCRLTAAA